MTEGDKVVVRDLTCGECKIELTRIEKNKLFCKKCNESYHDCANCPDRLDWSFDDRGQFCCQCGQHFCIYCWLHKGAFIPEENKAKDYYEDENYFCEKCSPISREQYLYENNIKFGKINCL